MPKKIYIVDLTKEERTHLLEFIKSGKQSARKLNRARILLLADEGKADSEIAKALHTGTATVQRTRQRFVEGNLEGALNERRVREGKRSWMRREKPSWKPWPTASRRKVGSVGHCSSWPTDWYN